MARQSCLNACVEARVLHPMQLHRVARLPLGLVASQADAQPRSIINSDTTTAAVSQYTSRAASPGALIGTAGNRGGRAKPVKACVRKNSHDADSAVSKLVFSYHMRTDRVWTTAQQCFRDRQCTVRPLLPLASCQCQGGKVVISSIIRSRQHFMFGM